MNIVLVGLMGSGKSTVGRILAQALGRPFIDTDRTIEEQAGMTIPTLFAAEGEAAFRQREAAVVAAVMATDGQVIATGGGAVLLPENRERMRQSGIVFWLDAPVEELVRRAVAQGLADRPLLAPGDPAARLRDLAETRAAAYQAAADYRVETGSLTAEDAASYVRTLFDGHRGDNTNATSAS